MATLLHHQPDICLVPLTKTEQKPLFRGVTNLLWIEKSNANCAAASLEIDSENKATPEYRVGYTANQQSEPNNGNHNYKSGPPRSSIDLPGSTATEMDTEARGCLAGKDKANQIASACSSVTADDHYNRELGISEVKYFEEGIDNIEGPIWDDPLDKESVRRQMIGNVSMDESNLKSYGDREDKDHQNSSTEQSEIRPTDEENTEYAPLHRCSNDTLARVRTEDLVAAAAALQISEEAAYSRLACTNCGGSKLREITPAKKARILAELVELEDAKSCFDEAELQFC